MSYFYANISYITLAGVDTVLSTYTNTSASDGSYLFTVDLSDLDFQGEWGKFRLVIVANEETQTLEFLDESITLTNNWKSLFIFGENVITGEYYLGQEWNMLFVTLSPIRENVTLESVKLEVINDTIYLVVSGSVDNVTGFLEKVYLTVKNVSGVFDNISDSENPADYLFHVPLGDLTADGDWRDIHLHVVHDVDGNEFTEPHRDFNAPEQLKDALNDAYEITFNGKTFAFSEWDSALKVVVSNPS